MTSQGTAHGRFSRAIAQRNLFNAEIAAKELGGLSLLDALDYLVLLAELRDPRFERAAVRFHGRLEAEAPMMTLAEATLALAALGDIGAGGTGAGGTESVDILKWLLRWARPMLVPALR